MKALKNSNTNLNSNPILISGSPALLVFFLILEGPLGLSAGGRTVQAAQGRGEQKRTAQRHATLGCS